MTEPLIIVSLLIVLFLGDYFLGIDISSIAVIYIILGRFSSQVINLVQHLQAFKRDIVSLEYCNSLLGDLDAKKELTGQKKWELKESFEIKDLLFSRDKTNLLENLDINLAKRKITVIYGKSGSGKSTILNLLLGLLDPTSGSIKVGEENLKDLDLKDFRSKVGFVNQESTLFNMSIRDNLKIRNSDVDDKQLISLINEFELESIFPEKKVDLDYVLDQSSSNLSGGERQRLTFIRELVLNPVLIILDEVTSSLDKKNVSKLINFISSLRSQMTVLIVTHQEEYFDIADDLYELDERKLIRRK